MKILYFAPIPYTGLKQRPQYIAEILAQKHEIHYIEPTISILKFRHNDFKGSHYKPSEHLHVIRPDGSFTAYRSVELFDFLHINTISERIQLRSLIEDCDLIWVGYPLWYNVISNAKNKKLIYDKMDENALLVKNGILRRFISQAEIKLIKKADLVFVSAQKFLDDTRKYNSNTYLIPNGVREDVPVFHPNRTDNGKYIFGYIGTISHWFDFEAIQTILNASNKNFVILAGPNEIPLIKHPRITYLGTIPHDKIPELIQQFDVCLYPFKKGPILDTINPVKIYEYLAVNKPVIAVRSRETEKFKDIILLYDNLRELERMAIGPFKPPFNDEQERMCFVKSNSWRSRVENIYLYFNNVLHLN